MYPLDGVPMIEHVYTALQSVADPVLVSTGREAQPMEGILARPVADRYPDGGPLAGIHAGLCAAPTSWLLVAACDMPFLTPEVLAAVYGATAGDRQVQAVIAETPDGRLQPLCACYHTSARAVAAATLAEGQRAVRAFIDRLTDVRIVPVQAEPLRNINHPSDLGGTE